MDDKPKAKTIHILIFFSTFALGIATLLTMQVVTETVPALDIWARELRGEWGNPSLYTFFEKVTVLGSSAFLASFTLIMAVWLWWRKKDLFASIVLLIGVIGSYALNKGIKFAVQRRRPDWVGAIESDGFSYPSGGAMLSLLCFALATYFLILHAHKGWSKVILFVITFTAVVLTGFSRYLLGAHYLTDVIAGFSFGFICLSVLIGLYHRFSNLNIASSD